MQQRREMIDVHLLMLVVNKLVESIEIHHFLLLFVFQSIGVGRYNLQTPVRDETVADKRRRSRKRVPFSSAAPRFGSAQSEILLK